MPANRRRSSSERHTSVVIDIDQDNETVQIGFMLDGEAMRAWVSAAHFEKMQRH
jgi:hypothetical protein